MTSLGSRRKDNSEARHPPEEQGQTGELLNHANHSPDRTRNLIWANYNSKLNLPTHLRSYEDQTNGAFPLSVVTLRVTRLSSSCFLSTSPTSIHLVVIAMTDKLADFHSKKQVSLPEEARMWDQILHNLDDKML